MRVSQRQLKGLVGGKDPSDLRAQIARLQELLAKEPVTIEKIVYVQKPPIIKEVEKIVTVEKVVEKRVEVPGPTKIEEKIVEKIVEVEKPWPTFTFGVKERNAQGRITRMAAASAQSEVRFDFNVVRDTSGNLSRVTMKAVRPEKTPTIYGRLN